jgi:iron complex outermembrane receptor protein
MRKFRGYESVLATLAGLPMLLSAGGSARADSTDNAEAPDLLGEVIVTARKREESALKVPVAITAFSAQALDAQNVVGIDDFTAITPGLSRDSTTTASARSDRSFEAIIIRGIVPIGTSGSGNPTTSVFVNGVPVTSGDVDGVFDFERVEVLKGPQSAYFGRETFGGAINLVTKDPGNEFHGYTSALAASGNDYDVKGAFEGPVIPDVLTFRTSVRWYKRDGSWNNEAEPGQKLGDQGTKSASLQVNFKPNENLSAKLYGVFWEDNDGPGATGVILPSQSNCNYGTHAYFCGKLPGLPAGEPSANTTLNPGVTRLIDNYPPLFGPSLEIDHYGLKRTADHVSLTVDDFVPSLGITLSSLTGDSEDVWSTIFPLNGIASPYPNLYSTGPYAQTNTNWPFGEEQRTRDFSQEFRVTSGQDSRFRWLVGASYLRTQIEFANSQDYYFGGYANTYNPIEYSSTYGVFYGLAFDLLPQVTIDFDGRYQSERLMAKAYLTDAIGYAATYHDYMPRVSLEYKISKDILAYFTYSVGVNPGVAEDPLLAIPPADVPQALAAGAKAGVKPETLYNYEAGLKGRFLDDRLILSGDVYYDIWSNKITAQDLLIVNPGGAPVYQSIFTNIGKVDLPGVELEVTAKPIDSFIFNLSGAVNDSHIVTGSCSACQLLTGSTNVSGNQLPNYSKFSGQASGEYSQAITFMPDFKWYERTEVTYKSGQFEGEGDYARSSAATNVNFRLGVRSGALNVEAFVTNAFNNKAYTSVLNDWNLSNAKEPYGAYDSVYVGLPFLRTYGARIRYDF